MDVVSVEEKKRNKKALKLEQIRGKRGNYNWVSNAGFSSLYDDDDDDDDGNDNVDDEGKEKECLVIDKIEFLESSSTQRSENNLLKEKGIQKYDNNFGKFHDNHAENSLGLNDKDKRVLYNFPISNAVCIISDDDDVNDDVNDDVHKNDDDVVVNDKVDDGVHVNDDNLNDGIHVNDVNDDNVNDGVHIHNDDVDGDDVNNVDMNADDDNDMEYDNASDDEDSSDDDDDDDGDGDDGDGDGDGDDGDGDDDGGKTIEDPNAEFQRKRFEGMILPANPIKTNADENDFIGRRTRSHFKPKSSSRKKKIKDGTLSIPIDIDIDESSLSSRDEEVENESESHQKYREDNNVDSEDNNADREDNNVVIKRKRGRPPKKKKENKVDELVSKGKARLRERVRVSSETSDKIGSKERIRVSSETYDKIGPKERIRVSLETSDKIGMKKRIRVSLETSDKTGTKKRMRNKEVRNILLNAMLENNASVNGAWSSDSLVSSASEPYVALKFSYGVEKPQKPNKSEEEQESEFLFGEMDFALGICEIGLQTSCLNDEEDEIAAPLASAIMHDELCREGKHFWIQDDEIGIKCKFCSIVKLEIKDVTPEFNDNPFGKSKEANRYYGQFPYDGTNNDSERFKFPDFSNDNRGDPSSSDTTQGTVWDLIPGTKKELYPHQRDGFEFLWKNIAGGIRINELGDLTKSGTGGCIICHAPGTGKTRLAIVFLQSFMKKYPNAKPVILAPYSMLRTWEEEFARWKVDIPFFNLNEKVLSGNEDCRFLKDPTGKYKTVKNEKEARMMKLATWIGGKGVLAVGYDLFQRLTCKKERVNEMVKEKGADEMIRKVLLEQPDILVLDEGHKPRNENSHLWKVLMTKVSTKRRVILSGTPFQNSFEELHSTISLVREEFAVPFYCQLNDNKRKIEVLRKQFEPFVHVHKGEILRQTLSALFHSLIVLRPSDLQNMFFARLATWRSSFIKFDNLISITSVHPSIFCNTKPNFLVEKDQALLEQHKIDLDAGVKARFLLELIRLCKGERILVFGQYIPPLNFIGELLKVHFHWTEGRELLQMYGNQDMKTRQSSIKLFNDPGSEARVLLASTKACCEGISLVGASRVVLLDVVWNPSVERQAISRAYRIGQQKDVFVYHLITSGTLEEEKYRRQTAKQRFGELLFCSSSPSLDAGIMHKTSTESRVVSKDRILEEMTNHDKTKNMFEKIVCQPKAHDLIKTFGSHDR